MEKKELSNLVFENEFIKIKSLTQLVEAIKESVSLTQGVEFFQHKKDSWEKENGIWRAEKKVSSSDRYLCINISPAWGTQRSIAITQTDEASYLPLVLNNSVEGIAIQYLKLDITGETKKNLVAFTKP